jgi:hypothetical protein
VLAAGADSHFVTVHSTRGYYYFARVPQERAGWGSNPERIIGPLTEAEFALAKREHGLPELRTAR